jgi:hypothetical protein
MELNMYFTDVLFRFFVMTGLTYVMLYGDIFDEGYIPIRPWLLKRKGKLGLWLNTIFDCPFCMSMWTGMIAWNLRYRDPRSWENLIGTIVFGFASVWVGGVLDMIRALIKAKLECLEKENSSMTIETGGVSIEIPTASLQTVDTKLSTLVNLGYGMPDSTLT